VKSSRPDHKATSWRACRGSSASSDALRAKGPSRTPLCHGGLGLPDAPSGRRRAGRDHPRRDFGTEEYIERPCSRPTSSPTTALVGRIGREPIETNAPHAHRGRARISAARAGLRPVVSPRTRPSATRSPSRALVLKCDLRAACAGPATARAMATAAPRNRRCRGIARSQSKRRSGRSWTMRTFPTVVVAVADITHGLRRVVELFEARVRKGLAKIAEQDAWCLSKILDNALTVVITTMSGEEHRTLSRGARACFFTDRDRSMPAKALTRVRLPARSARDPWTTIPSITFSARSHEVYKSRAWTQRHAPSRLIVSPDAQNVRTSTKGATGPTFPGRASDRFDSPKPPTR